MIRKIFVAVTLAAISTIAIAEMRTITAAYEVAAADFRAPGTDNGTLGMRECGTCASRTLRVNSQTRYSVNDEPVSLSDFRAQFAENRNAERALIIVSHHLESNTVTAVTLIL